MKKRLVSLMVVIAIALSFSPVIAHAATSGTCGDNLMWTLNDEGTLIISGIGVMKDYYGSSSPFSNKNIKKVIIEEGTENIGDFAFYGCKSIESIVIPNTVVKIGHQAFDECELLTSVEMPNSITSINIGAFAGCASLTDITVPDSVIEIGWGAFEGCESLTSVKIPSGVTSIERIVFANCKSLTKVTIPKGIIVIGEQSFAGCASLTDITIPNSVVEIGSRAFVGCASLTDITIPNGVKTLSWTFSSCTSLKNIRIPNSVTSIGGSAFSNCTSLTEVTIPDSVIEIGWGAFSDCTSLTDITIPDSVTSIDSKAFAHCTSLTSVTIPKSITSITYDAFAGCTLLESVVIPSEVTSIGVYAFGGCTSLADIYYSGSEEQWKSIKKGASYGISSDTTIHYNYGKADATQIITTKGDNPILVHVEKNSNYLTDYISGAFVNINSFGTATTNENGNAELDNSFTDDISKETQFTVTKEGYRDYISDIIIYNVNADLLFQSNSVQINMTKLNIEDNERPYISTLLYKSPYSDIKNVLINKETFSQDDSGAIHFKAYAVWNGKTPDKFVLYQENGFSVESKDGNFTVFAKSFEPSKDIYIRAIASDGTQSISECTKIKIKAPIIPSSTEPTLSFINMDNTFLPSDIPFLNDTDLKIKLDLPFSYTVKDNKLRLVIGVVDNDGSTDASKTFADDEHWKDWKKFCESTSNQNKTRAEWVQAVKNMKMDWTSSVKLDCKAVGYFEFDLNNQNESMEGGINLSADAKATFQTQYAVGPVPVYFKFSFGGKFGANYIGGYNFAQEQFYGRIEGNIEPYISAEGGVGVLYVATVGVNGKGSMPIKMDNVFEGINKVDLKAELAITASVLCFDYKKTFASRTWNLFPGENNAQTLSLMSVDNYELESRDYINNESVWYGSDNKIRLFSTSVIDESVLQSNIYPKAKPQIMVCDGKTIAVWLADNTDRDNINKTMLVYSVHNSNGTWSEPQAIYDDGCADFYPYAKDGYVVWQKTNKQLSDSDDLITLAGAGEIMYAKWNGNGFDTAVRVTNNDISDTMPRIATNGSDVSIVWVSNSDNNIWGTSGSNQIHIKNLSSSTENTIDVTGLIANLDAEYINSKLQVAYTTDIDMDLNTLDDRGVYIYEDNNVQDITDSDILTSNPKYVEIDNETYLMWYSDNSIYSRNSNGEINTVYTDESGLLSDDFNVITSDNGYAAIIWTATKDVEYRQIQGVIYNPQSKEWSKEVYISDSDSDVCYPDGIINNDGSMLLMYNRSSEQSDLCVTELVPSYDLAIEDVSYNESDIAPETDLPISVKIKNSGYLDVETVSIDLNGNKQTIPTSIKPGETTNISCLYPIGETVTHQTIAVNVAVPNDTDNTPDDNNTILEIGYADAEMVLKSNVQDDKILCNINVTNNSYIDTTGTLTIRGNSIDGEIIDSIDIGAITNDETHQITYNIATSMLASYPDLKNIYFVVETDDDEIYNTNNYDFVAGILEDSAEETTQIINPIGYYCDKVNIEEKVTGEQITFTISPFDGELSDLQLDLQLYVAEYNDSGTLDKVTIGESTVIDNSIVLDADLPKSANYKLMIWDNRQRPLIEAITTI